tara:strand:+ start:411 stop:1121 length:711 start_codon:yes stop_codon:yes gene_type:complete
MSYKVNVNDFEGPLDLLLFFIQRDKLNIYDIPISKITNDFLEYISELDKMNIQVGANFIYMASLLMRVKVKMLLPKDESILEEDVDPREDLVNQLIEYKKIKELSNKLFNRGENYLNRYHTSINEKYRSIETQNFSIGGFSLYDIIRTYGKLINKLPDSDSYQLIDESHSIADETEFIKSEIIGKKKIAFKNIIKKIKSKIHFVYIFVAILEMIKNSQIRIEQKNTFSEIYIINSF